MRVVLYSLLVLVSFLSGGCVETHPNSDGEHPICTDQLTDTFSEDCNDSTQVPASVIGGELSDPILYIQTIVISEGTESGETEKLLQFEITEEISTVCFDSIYYRQFSGVPYEEPYTACLHAAEGEIQYTGYYSRFGIVCYDDSFHRIIVYATADYEGSTHTIATSAVEVYCYAFDSNPETSDGYSIENPGPWNVVSL